MWAPADLFGPGLSAFLLPLKRATTFLYESPAALAATILFAAGLIAVVTLVGGRRSDA